MSSPVARTLEALRQAGYEAAVVERYIPRGPIHGLKFDLFGIADVEAMAEKHTLYVQVCRDSDLNDHLAKCMAAASLPLLLACPARQFEIWSWALRGKRGLRKTWSERRFRAVRSHGRIVFEGCGP